MKLTSSQKQEILKLINQSFNEDEIEKNSPFVIGFKETDHIEYWWERIPPKGSALFFVTVNGVESNTNDIVITKQESTGEYWCFWCLNLAQFIGFKVNNLKKFGIDFKLNLEELEALNRDND